MIFQPNLIAHVVEPVGRGQHVNPSPYTTHFIGTQQHPLVTSRNSSVFVCHYLANPEPFSGTVKRLTFLQLGSCEFPNLLPFASTCTTVEFSGHINNVETVYAIMRQLPKANKISIKIGPGQQYFQPETYDEFFRKTLACPSVKRLSINVDLEYFYSFQHFDCDSSNSSFCSSGKCLSSQQFSLICLVEAILKHAGDSFPNLKNLDVDLPENDRLCAAVQNLIQTCPALRSKTKTRVQDILSRERRPEQMPIPFHLPPNPIEVAPWEHQQNQLMSDQYHHCPGYPVPSDYNRIVQQNLHSPSDITVLNDFKPVMMSTPVTYRPPPGFEPMGHSEQVNAKAAQFSPGYHNAPQDVHQRVNSWLRTLDKWEK